ncbi:MAG: hypothetical protein AB8B56_02045 [Crocinitomicaceae bacterium]
MPNWKGNNPQRSNLTGQPRGQHAMNDTEAVRVMDELVLLWMENHPLLPNNARYIASQWRNGFAQIRDYAHCGGRDHRMHITVTDLYSGANFHIPVASDVPGQWRVDVFSY